MFIEIESSHKVVPLLLFKRVRQSSVIKKSEIRIYNDAKAMLMAIENQVLEYQKLIEQQTVKIIEEKEQELNEHIRDLQTSASQQLMISQQQWYETSENQLRVFLAAQEEKLNKVAVDVKNRTETAIRNRLIRMNQSESLIGYLTDALHAEINDIDQSLVIVQSVDASGMTLTIENDDGMVSLNTQELLSELKCCIENAAHD